MRVLLSAIGSRGDVQPLVALASRLRESGQEVCLCVRPGFRDWIEGLGFPVMPVGPRQIREAGAAAPWSARHVGPSPERQRQLAEATTADQFAAIAKAAQGCDVVVAAAGRLPVAARSVAETLGIRYVFAAFCPQVLPSPHHGPPLPAARQEQPPSAAGNRELWSRHAERFNDRYGPALNRQRAAAGLAPVDDVLGHVFTSRPWLAADPVLAPWPGPADGDVLQTGAWTLPDDRPLDPELEAFLQAGDPPVYFGFGSMQVPPDLAQVIVAAARQTRRRAIIYAGSAGLTLTSPEPGCLVIGEVNQQKLFEQVAAVVHHGGAGTTTTAALAGAPQVIIPQINEQHYWAQRVRHLGIGTAHPPGTPDADSLAAALEQALQPGVAARARSISPAMPTDGTRAAAANLIAGPGIQPEHERMPEPSAAHRSVCSVVELPA